MRILNGEEAAAGRCMKGWCVNHLLVVAVVFLTSPLGAVSEPFLVKNIASSPDSEASSQSAGFQPCGGLIYFTAADGASGRDLWRTDKTERGTFPLTRISANPYFFSTPRLYAVETGCVFFASLDFAPQIWRTDGTPAGTFPLNVERPAFEVAVVHAGSLFFLADDCKLWRTDGTQGGTQLVAEFCPALFRPALASHQGQLFFLTEEFLGRRLWASDGTQKGTRPVVRLAGPLLDPNLSAPQFFSVGHNLFLAEDQREYSTYLWRTDGTESGTVLLADTERSGFSTLNDHLVFLRGDPETGVEPWISDGTLEGTFLLKDVNPGPGSPFTQNHGRYFPHFFEWRGLLLFIASEPEHGFEPWCTDGTPEGTRLLHDVRPGPADAFDYYDLQANLVFFTAAGDFVLFSANDGEHGVELWRTDGTDEGTRLVADIFPSEPSSYPAKPVVTNNIAVFPAADGIAMFPGIYQYRFELWRTDGTPSGTALLADIWPGPRSSRPSELAAAGNDIIFVANDGTGSEPWLTNGTREGTCLLKDIVPTDASASPESLTDFDGTLAFAATDDSGRVLWLSDGRSTATERLTSTSHPDGFTDARHLVRLGHHLAFAARESEVTRTLFLSDGAGAEPRPVRTFDDVFRIHPFGKLLLLSADDGSGTALWASDGTTTGTRRLTSPREGYPDAFATAGDRVLFLTRDGTYRWALWRTDGTGHGTVLIIGFGDEGPEISSGIIALNDRLFFVLKGCGAAQLWATDGVEGDAEFVADLTPGGRCDYSSVPTGEMAVLDNSVFIVATSRQTGEELFRLSGTSLRPVRDIAEPGGSFPAQLTVVGHSLYFTAFSTEHGTELWRTDGTDAGTTLVKDIAPGPASSDPQSLAAVNGLLAFTADDGRLGREAWISCGTEATTVTLHDIAPGRASSDPRSFTASGDFLFFSANDRIHGAELWAVPLSSLDICTTTGNAHSMDSGCGIGNEAPARGPTWMLLFPVVFGWRRRIPARRRSKIWSGHCRCQGHGPGRRAAEHGVLRRRRAVVPPR
jgi:ELWxxDGT repeat protein